MASLQAALPGSYYTDDAHWRREADQVLLREWFCAGRLSTWGLETGTHGRLAVVDVAGESILVTRTREGALRAFFNVCRHRGSQVVPVDPDRPPPDPCAAAALRCPYHSWTYDLAGRLMRAPHTEDVDDFRPADFSLREVEVDTWGGFLFLRLRGSRAHGPGRRARRGARADPAVPARDARRSAGTLTYDVRANYKVVLENYNECYHCAGVHPELVRLVPAFGRGGTDLDWDAGIPHRDGAWTFTATGTSTASRSPGWTTTRRPGTRAS